MRAMLLDGTDEGTSWMVPHIVNAAEARGYQVEHFRIRDETVKRCLGCFGCWIKTPGVCLVDDAGRRVAEGWARSDLLVIATPVTFGTYSHILKRALDRIIPSILPYFTRINGEVHHSRRYRYEQRLLVFGHLDGEDAGEEQAFRELVSRNALNFHVVKSETVMLDEEGAVGQVGEAFSRIVGASA